MNGIVNGRTFTDAAYVVFVLLFLAGLLWLLLRGNKEGR